MQNQKRLARQMRSFVCELVIWSIISAQGTADEHLIDDIQSTEDLQALLDRIALKCGNPPIAEMVRLNALSFGLPVPARGTSPLFDRLIQKTLGDGLAYFLKLRREWSPKELTALADAIAKNVRQQRPRRNAKRRTGDVNSCSVTNGKCDEPPEL